jgi:Zn-dependent M32 family carboxypeptidase
MASDYNWLKNEVSADDVFQKDLMIVCQHLRQVDRLVRCRKLLVFAEFEREIYRDPLQDLDLLWHNLNMKYLGQNFPVDKGASYWAANKSATSLSCTIHNFVLADIFSAQLQHIIEKGVLTETNSLIQDNKAIGKYLVENLYSYGNLLPWEKLIEKATTEPLNPEYFVEQLIGNENKNN